MRLFRRGGADPVATGSALQSVDVLADQADPRRHQGYSDWPTIPQLYVKGEFVGGCDIVREMFQAGELGACSAKRASRRRQMSGRHRGHGVRASAALPAPRLCVLHAASARPSARKLRRRSAPSRCGSGSARRWKPKALTDVGFTAAGCLGFCNAGPLMVVYPDGVWYRPTTAEDIDEIVEGASRAGPTRRSPGDGADAALSSSPIATEGGRAGEEGTRIS